ncbi:elongation of very long chain fatty acids protein-like [Anthonomus grandis grandis]|uniref:elongation of very long chain fatty acids protein-like n=1 Tax=Anthonomus grandis grandis TaxID=2921223 RepID=UPI002166142B|nr:elongation of very long chain fatty acids protein-like [Anthonomus grandis grandis]
MALLLKRFYEGYFWLMSEVADPRANDYFLMSSPIPTILIIILWFKFILHWGPDYMKNRQPFDLKKIMIIYNVIQVILNVYIVYYVYLARNVINWRCGEIDYSNSYWGRKFLSIAHLYYMLKILDLIDTVFFVLRKKTSHISFLHTYHHFGMVILAWVGTKFVGGGHSYFLGMANAIVHTILYCYYLLTSYDSRYGKLIWLKKFITQAQLLQFAFLILSYGQLLFQNDCKYPKIVSFFFVPQNIFMIILFGDFYVRNYILEPRRKKRQAAAKEMEIRKNYNKSF